jgi:hypothetical protein
MEVKERSQTSPRAVEARKNERSEFESLSQVDFCQYLNEDSSNVAARAKRRGLSTEDYLKAVARERFGEIWQRELERPNKARWVRVHE